MAVKHFPRLLVVAEFPPGDTGGGGALVRQLLQGYPPDAVFWWSCRKDLVKPPSSVAQCQFAFAPPVRLLPTRKARRLKSWLLESFWSPFAAWHLQRVTKRLSPDRVWALPYRWSISPTFYSNIISAFPAHVSVWDYPDNRAHRHLLGEQRAHRMMAMLENLYATACTCDVISQPMLMDMAGRTSRSDALLIHSGVDQSHFDRIRGDPVDSSDTIRLAYAGTIVVPHVFELLIKALDVLRPKLPKPLVLEFFGGRPYRQCQWFNPEWMREHVHLDDSKFYDALNQCTWGIVTMDLTDDDPRYNRFSFPNKFGTYLSAGLPVIVLGHGESSGVKMLQQYPVGIWTDTASIQQLRDWLGRVLSDSRPKATFREQILRCARTEFNIVRIRNELWNALGVGPGPRPM